MITGSADFYSVSGCRDLLFNVIEHRFTMAEINELLARHGLSFLGFDIEPQMLRLFRNQFPNASLTDLQQWHAFEMANPLAFKYMYVFWVRKDART